MIILRAIIKDKFSIQLFVILVTCWLINSHGSIIRADDLRAYPTSVVFKETEGNASGTQRSIYLFTTSGAGMNWTLSKNASWITTNLTAGVTESVLKIGVTTSSLMNGIYTGNVVVQSSQSTAAPIVISVTLILNPNVPVTITPWKNDYDGAMSVSVDDSQGSGFDALVANGFTGTYFLQGNTPPSFSATYFNAGMELGSHTIHHYCDPVSDSELRTSEIEPSISAICTKTPEPCKDLISMAWPCGETNYREQSVVADYFLSARGYNHNLLEDATPEDFMDLKSYNSHEHTPYPPSDLKTVVDLAVSQKKWFNLVLHTQSNDDGATAYAKSKSIWVAPIGTIIKYIVQRDRFILTDYIESTVSIKFNVSRLAIPSSAYKNFEDAFGSNDLITMQIDVDDSKTVDNVYINGMATSYQKKLINGNLVLLTDVKLESAATSEVEVSYVNKGIGLSISGITANNKVYDGTTSANLNIGNAVLVGVLTGDDVTLETTGAAGTFTNKNVGTGKTVITSGFALAGADAAKYYLTQPAISADITSVGLTITGTTANNKIYDRTTTATLNTGSSTLSGILSGDFVTLIKTGASGTFASRNAGSSKTVAVSGFTLSGADAGNYTLAQPSLTANITPAALTVSGVTANDKVYDGNTAAAINTGSAILVGVIAVDAVTLVTAGASGNFDNPLAGTSKIVYTSGFTITGTDSGNYTLTQPTATASIIGIKLTVTGVTANNKVYNGTTVAVLNTGSAALSGVIAGDVVTLVKTGATGTFNNKNAGTSKTVTASGFTLSGADAGKYSVTQPTTTANITSASLSISGVTVNNKVYNGTTAATLNTGGAVLNGIVTGDVVNLVVTGATGTFNSKTAGTAKTVTISGFTISGTDSGNYTLTQPAATANITAASLTITGVTAGSKVYDASTAATLSTAGAVLTGAIAGDEVILVTSGASGTFTNKAVGAGKTVSTTGFTLSGADASNYSLVQPSLTANITAAVLTVSGVRANNKVYNGTTSTSVNGTNASLSGVIGGDVVTLVFSGASGTFVNKNTGTSKAVTITGITLGGADGNNYTLTQPTATADITVAPVTVSGVIANNKIYDGTTAATLNTSGSTLSVKYGTDDVNIILLNASGTFSDKNVGTGKLVTTSGFVINGTDAGNYSLSQPSLAASILPRTLTVTANNLFKPYKTALTFTGDEYTYEGLLAGDILSSFTLSSPGAKQSSPVGEYVITISGGSIPNYSIIYVSGTLSVGKYILTARADDKTKTYGAQNPALSITYSGFVNGDAPAVLDELPSASTKAKETSDPGIYPITLSGGADDTYDIKFENGNLEISKALLTVTADSKSKVYGDANPELTVSYSGFMLEEDQRVLDKLPVAESDVTENSDAGEYKITVSGAADNDYAFIYNEGTFTVNKEDQVISFDNIPASLRMTQEVNLDAQASSGLPVDFRLSDPKKARLNGNVLELVADGNLVVTAVQMGDRNHNPAKDVSKTIDVLPTFDNISSLFTPNADGMNDYWYIPQLEEYGNIQVTVYNRFGQPVYESDSYKNDWDGTWKGKPLPSAAYYYIIKSSLKGFIKGVVNIVR
jgi:gliding motility-associated-like protein